MAYYAGDKEIEEKDLDSLYPLPGETQSQFSSRLADRGLTAPDNIMTTVRDNTRIDQLKRGIDTQTRGILDEQAGIQKTRLDELAALLAQEEGRKFNQAIPEIAESAQAQGFLQTSGFGNALARERSKLAGETQFRLGEQALQDRDLQITGLGNLGQDLNNLDVAGVERTFSTDDLTRSEDLARELARLGVVSNVGTQRGVSGFQGALQGASVGSAFGPVGAAIGGIAGVGMAKQSRGTPSYLCTHMKNLGILSSKEVKKIHNKVMPVMRNHPIDWLMYNLWAPIFITLNPSYDWQGLKVRLYDNVMAKDSKEEAFKEYKKVVMELFKEPMNKGVVEYGY